MSSAGVGSAGIMVALECSVRSRGASKFENDVWKLNRESRTEKEVRLLVMCDSHVRLNRLLIMYRVGSGWRSLLGTWSTEVGLVIGGRNTLRQVVQFD